MHPGVTVGHGVGVVRGWVGAAEARRHAEAVHAATGDEAYHAGSAWEWRARFVEEFGAVLYGGGGCCSVVAAPITGTGARAPHPAHTPRGPKDKDTNARRATDSEALYPAESCALSCALSLPDEVPLDAVVVCGPQAAAVLSGVVVFCGDLLVARRDYAAGRWFRAAPFLPKDFVLQPVGAQPFWFEGHTAEMRAARVAHRAAPPRIVVGHRASWGLRTGRRDVPDRRSGDATAKAGRPRPPEDGDDDRSGSDTELANAWRTNGIIPLSTLLVDAAKLAQARGRALLHLPDGMVAVQGIGTAPTAQTGLDQEWLDGCGPERMEDLLARMEAHHREEARLRAAATRRDAPSDSDPAVAFVDMGLVLGPGRTRAAALGESFTVGQPLVVPWRAWGGPEQSGRRVFGVRSTAPFFGLGLFIKLLARCLSNGPPAPLTADLAQGKDPPPVTTGGRTLERGTGVVLRPLGLPVVLCCGPGAEDTAREYLPQRTLVLTDGMDGNGTDAVADEILRDWGVAGRAARSVAVVVPEEGGVNCLRSPSTIGAALARVLCWCDPWLQATDAWNVANACALVALHSAGTLPPGCRRLLHAQLCAPQVDSLRVWRQTLWSAEGRGDPRAMPQQSATALVAMAKRGTEYASSGRPPPVDATARLVILAPPPPVEPTQRSKRPAPERWPREAMVNGRAAGKRPSEKRYPKKPRLAGGSGRAFFRVPVSSSTAACYSF